MPRKFRRTTKGAIKRYSLNMRTTHAMRKRIEDAAGQSGRSLLQEVEFRLEKSFVYEDMLHFFGAAREQTRELVRLILYCITRAEAARRSEAGDRLILPEWHKDPALAQHLCDVIQIVTAAFMTGKDVTPLKDLAAELQAAGEFARAGHARHVSPARLEAWAILLNIGLVLALAPDHPETSHPQQAQP
jgi:hypothetical protein